MAASSVENDVKAPNKAILDFDKETILGKKFLYIFGSVIALLTAYFIVFL